MKTKTNYQLQNVIEASKDQAFIDESGKLTATTGTPGPGQFLSSIIGRASIPDIAKDFRASLGIERIPVQQIILLQNEFGPNGEPVSAALNDTRGLIRFVGSWIPVVGTYGQYIQTPTSNTTDYVEVTIYGTGLNIVTINANAGNCAVSYDAGYGVSETTVTISGSSSVIYGRNNANCITSLVQGLTLGFHVIKIRTTAQILVYGFEILNSNASGLININPERLTIRTKK